MIRIKLFDGVEKPLVVYNRQALLDYAIDFYTEECDSDFVEDEEDFTFPSYSSCYFRVFNERIGRELVDISGARSGSNLIFNASVSDMTFADNGMYYYEIGYTQTGGYEVVLMYGKLSVI